ncbi:carbon-nitrogen hydrolase family protein [Micromonosporaceae bacterium Da 78-11]
MRRSLRIGACQTPEVLADVPAALAVVESFAARADAAELDLLLFPECFLQGYLVTEQHVDQHAVDLTSAAFGPVLERLAAIRQTLVLGVIERQDGRFFNSAVVLTRGKVAGVYRKTHPTDREPIFTAGTGHPVFDLNGIRFGINICSDTRFTGAAQAVAAQGGAVLLVPAQNMMRLGNAEIWRPRHNAIRAERARETGMWLVSADVTGQRDRHQIGYGPTSVIDPRGRVVAQVPLLTVGMVTTEITGSA